MKALASGAYETLVGLAPVEEDDEDASGSPSAAAAAPAGAPPSAFPLHRAAFEGDLPALRRLLAAASPEDKARRDPHGLTALHVAVLRGAGNAPAVAALLAAGLSPQLRSSRRWTPLDEAVALGDARLAELLYASLRLEVKAERRARKAHLLAAAAALPDFSLRLSWQLASPLFGALLRRFAPSDAYTLTKVGPRLRLDGALRGAEKAARGRLPRWRRGAFSLLVDAGADPVAALMVDHVDKTVVDLTAERRAASRDARAVVAALLAAAPPARARVRAADAALAPATRWFGRAAAADPDDADGYPARVYEYSARLSATVAVKAPLRVPRRVRTYRQLLAHAWPPDDVSEVPYNPLKGPPAAVARAVAAGRAPPEPGGDGDWWGAPRGGGAPPRPRRVSGRVWLAEGYPLGLAQMLPLLDALADANRHIGDAARAVAGLSADAALFPVRLQLPLVWTVSLVLAFEGFRALDAEGVAALGGGFFDAPPGYAAVRLDLGGGDDGAADGGGSGG